MTKQREKLELMKIIYPNYMDKTYTSAKLYNVKDKINPTLERTVEVEGDYLTARMIGSNVYIVSNKYMYYAAFISRTIIYLSF